MTKDDLLGTLWEYFGEAPFLVDLDLMVSPANEDEEFHGSQTWHSDFDDSKILKIFIPIKKITDNSGPFMFLDKRDSFDTINQKSFRWGSGLRSHNDNLVNNNKNQIIKFTGDHRIC